MDPNKELLNDIFKMTKENNKMLHAMRRRAFVGAFMKAIFIIVVVAAPIWFYMTYLNETVQDILKTMQQIQDTGASAQQQISDWGAMWQAFQKNLPFTGEIVPPQQ